MRVILLSLFLVVISSCSFSRRQRLIEEVSSWKGKRVEFSEDFLELYGRIAIDTVPYYFIYYVDSTICLSCRINPWSRVISEIEDSVKHPVLSVLISSPHSKFMSIDEINEVSSPRPFFVDNNSEFLKLNNLPKSDLLHVILVDSTNTVRAIGNPIMNGNMEKLYISCIRELDNERKKGREIK